MTGDIFTGERCILHCNPGYKPINRRTAICDPHQKWMPNANFTCVPVAEHQTHLQQQYQEYMVKPFIKCPPDSTKILGPDQKTMLINMERPKTNVDWFK